MSRITWDNVGEHYYETGVRNCVLYPYVKGTQNDGYTHGVAWNGITSITESPSGADETKLWADDIKYLSMRAAEEFGGTIEAYTYPDEFAECDGSVALATGAYIGQQPRKVFGICYRTVYGNDTELENHGYKLHLVYGATASPSQKGHQTVNDSPDAITFSWEFSTTPVPVKDHKPTALLTIDTTKTTSTGLKALEDALYGTDNKEAYLPLPDEVVTLLATV